MSDMPEISILSWALHGLTRDPIADWVYVVSPPSQLPGDRFLVFIFLFVSSPLNLGVRKDRQAYRQSELPPEFQTFLIIKDTFVSI